MTFLQPWAAVLAAAVSLPLLLLLYFLKLRRRRLSMASTLLWRKSFADLQVNAPFQRLRLSVLFLLHLLLLLLIVLAIGEPVIDSESSRASRIILLMDRSASMNAADAGGTERVTRLTAAKAAAADVMERLVSRRGGGSVMVIEFAARARLVTGFESRRDVLRDAIESIEPTDEEANLDAALQLAATFARPPADADETIAEPPDVILVSDGGVAPPDDPNGFSLRSGRFRYLQIGPDESREVARRGPGVIRPSRNVGIVSLSARRDYDAPSQVTVFARLINAGPEPAERLVRLLVDGEPGPMKRVSIDAPASRRDASVETGSDSPAALSSTTLSPPGEATVTFSIELPSGGLIAVRHETADDLEADDTAVAVLPPPIRPRVLLVRGDGENDAYLEDLLLESEPAELRSMSASAFAELETTTVDSGRRYDLVVFDSTPPRRLPGIPSVTFGAAPAGVDVSSPSTDAARRILSWQRQHPLMRYVALDTIVYRGIGGLQLPVGATPLATGPDGPVIALIPARGAQHVVVAFELAKSNWTRHVSVAIFMQNVLDFLTLARSGQSSLTSRPGATLFVRARPGTSELAVRGPGGSTHSATLDAAGELATLPTLRRVGLYQVDGAEPPYDRVAVSMLSDVESDIRPRETLVVNAESTAAGSVAGTAPRGIWPWFVGAAFGILVLEWLVYCRILQV